MDGWMDATRRRVGEVGAPASAASASSRQPAEIFTSGLRRILSWS